jgi:hypothetical protein
METGLINPGKYASKWAFIYLAAAAVNTFVIQNSDQGSNPALKSLGYTIPFIVLLIVTQLEFRKSLGGYISFQQAFSGGVRYAVYSGLLFGLLIFIYLTFFSNQVAQSAADLKKTLVASGLSKEQVDMQIGSREKYGAVIGGFFAAIQTTIIGVIISAIGAAILKKEVAK